MDGDPVWSIEMTCNHYGGHESILVTDGCNYKDVRYIHEQDRIRRGDVIGLRLAKCLTFEYLCLLVWHVYVGMWLCIANRTVIDNSLYTELQLVEKSTASS
jgi:hypothetical protein